ncbi:hypothetical protein Tco_1126298 [Tanacetum coccineum]
MPHMRSTCCLAYHRQLFINCHINKIVSDIAIQEAYQIHAGPQVSSLDLAAPVNDNHNDPPACTHPNAYADANTNLHLITPYTLNYQHQQCTTIRDVTGLAVRNSEESRATSLTTNNRQSHMPQTQRRHQRLVFAAHSESMSSEMKDANILDVTPTTDSSSRKYKDGFFEIEGCG